MDELELLLQRARAGDRRANNELGEWMTAQLMAFFRTRYDAERSWELAQRTLLDLLERLAQRPMSAAELLDALIGFGWIEVRRSRARRALDRQRAAYRAEHAEVLEPRRAIDELFAGQERWEIAESMLEDLPTTHREVLLARLRGHSYKTIVAVFNIKIEAARARVRVAKLRIIERWERERVTRTTFRSTDRAF